MGLHEQGSIGETRGDRIHAVDSPHRQLVSYACVGGDGDAGGCEVVGKGERAERARLKTCLKQGLESAAMGLSAGCGGEEEEEGKKTLRRVKTVDFEDAEKWVGGVSLLAGVADHGKTDGYGGLGKRVHAKPRGLGAVGRRKSAPADPAITRADVHVIAITPSWKPDGVSHDDDNGGDKQDDPVTPTMQIVESRNGCYQVIWDNVPPESPARVDKRRSFSASHSLIAVSPTATRGLERVNSKLTDWSGTWNSPSESFKPTIVVFPDDGGRQGQGFERGVHEDQDTVICVPPNSQLTSAVPSRWPSRPNSSPVSRATSLDHLGLEAALADQPQGTEHRGIVSPSRDRVASFVGENKGFPYPVMARVLSDVEDVGLLFRCHRDSVAIAHRRFVRGRAIEADSCTGGESVAGKRMNKGGHAVFDDDGDDDVERS